MYLTAASVNAGIISILAGVVGVIFFPSFPSDSATGAHESSTGPYHRVDKLLEAVARVVEKGPECVCNVVVESSGPA